jgi:hypothetical protein
LASKRSCFVALAGSPGVALDRLLAPSDSGGGDDNDMVLGEKGRAKVLPDGQKPCSAIFRSGVTKQNHPPKFISLGVTKYIYTEGLYHPQVPPLPYRARYPGTRVPWYLKGGGTRVPESI